MRLRMIQAISKLSDSKSQNYEKIDTAHRTKQSFRYMLNVDLVSFEDGLLMKLLS